MSQPQWLKEARKGVFGVVKRVKLKAKESVAGQVIGFRMTWVTPPGKTSEGKVPEPKPLPLLYLKPYANDPGAVTASGHRIVAYEVLVSAGMASGLAGLRKGEDLEVEDTGETETTRQGFRVKLFNVIRPEASIFDGDFFQTLPTQRELEALPANTRAAFHAQKVLTASASNADDTYGEPPTKADAARAVWGHPKPSANGEDESGADEG